VCGELLFTRASLQGYEVGKSTTAKDNVSKKVIILPSYFMNELTERDGITDSNSLITESPSLKPTMKDKVITGIRKGNIIIKITLENERGKLPLFAEFYKRLVKSKT
jgi:hypothetical protein